MFQCFQRFFIKRKLKKITSQYFNQNVGQWVFRNDDFATVIHSLPLDLLNQLTVRDLTRTGISEVASIDTTLADVIRLFDKITDALSNREYVSDIIRGRNAGKRALLEWLGGNNRILLGDALVSISDTIKQFDVILQNHKETNSQTLINYTNNFRNMFLQEVATVLALSIEALKEHMLIK